MKIITFSIWKDKNGNLTQNFPQEMTFKMRSDQIEVSQREKHFGPTKNMCKGPEVESLRSERRTEGGRLAAKESKQRTL